MKFAFPYAFLLLLALPLLWRRMMAAQKPAPLLMTLPVSERVPRLNPTQFSLLLKVLSWVFLVVALARPQTSFKLTERTVSGLDIMMVMDFSASMNIEDLAERSRFEIAKEVMQEFIKGRKNDRIGFVIFSGEPLTLAPPTLDYGLVLKALQEAQIGVLKDGTAIGDGLSLAVERLRNSPAKSKVVILLTDGENNVGQVDPATAGELAAGFGIRVYTIAIGKEGRVKLPIKQKGLLGNEIVTYQWFDNALNPELLQLIAQKTSGKFYRVTDYDTLGQVFHEIDQLEKTEIKTTEKVKYEEAFAFWVKLALLLLLVEQILSRGAWRVLT